MNEVIENTIQTQEPPIVRENLFVRMHTIRAKYPTIKMNQTKIAKATRYDQSSISLAMRNPARLPEVAKKIEKYFDRFESRIQSTQSNSASA